MLSMFKGKKGFSVLFSNRTDEQKVSGSNTPRTLSRISTGSLPARTSLSRCQRCGKNFKVSNLKCMFASTCLRCSYPVCQFCCEPQNHPEVRVCYVCARSFSFMKLFGKTSYGSDLVVRVLEYCNPRAERIMKSFFPLAVDPTITGQQINNGSLVANKRDEPTQNSVPFSKPGVNSYTSHPYLPDSDGAANRKLSFDDDLANQQQPRCSDVLNPKSYNQLNQQETLTRTITTHRDVSPKAAHIPCDNALAAHNLEEDIENSPPASKPVFYTNRKINGNMPVSKSHSLSMSFSIDRKLPSEDPNKLRTFERELTFPSRTISVVAEESKRVTCGDEGTNPLCVPAGAVAEVVPKPAPKKESALVVSLFPVITGSEMSSVSRGSDRSMSPAPRFPTFTQFLDEQKKTSGNRYSVECLITVSPESEELVVTLGAKRVSTNLKPSRATRCEVVTPPLQPSEAHSSDKISSKKKANRSSSRLSSSIQPRSTILHVVPHPRHDSKTPCPTIAVASSSARKSAKIKVGKSNISTRSSNIESKPSQNLHFCRQEVVSISPIHLEASNIIRRSRISRSTLRVACRRSTSKRNPDTEFRREQTRSKISRCLTRNTSVNANLAYYMHNKNNSPVQDRSSSHAHSGRLKTSRAATAKRQSPNVSRTQQHASSFLSVHSTSLLPANCCPTTKVPMVRTHSAIPCIPHSATASKQRPLKASPLRREPTNYTRITRTLSAFSPLTRTHSTRAPIQPFNRLSTATPSTRLVRSHSATVTHGRVATKPRPLGGTPPASQRHASPHLITPRVPIPSADPHKTPRHAGPTPAEPPSTIRSPLPTTSPFRRIHTNANVSLNVFRRKATQAKVAVEDAPGTRPRPESTTRVKSVAKTRPGEKQGKAAPVPSLIHVPSPARRQRGGALSKPGGTRTHPHTVNSTFFPVTPRRQFILGGPCEKSTSRRGTIELKGEGRRSTRPLLSVSTPKNHLWDGLSTPANSETFNNNATHKPIAKKVKPKGDSNGVAERALRKPNVAQTVVHITKSDPTTQRTSKPIF